MPSRSRSAVAWLRRRAENVIVALIGLMFVSFLLQIVFRYALNRPLGWTDEVTVLCWVWLVLWGAAFILSDKDEIRFDIVYGLVSRRTRRTFTLISSVALVVLFIVSLPASWNYVLFMKREKSAYLGMRFDYLYSIYLIFAVACIFKHGWIAWYALRGRESPEEDALKDEERV
ncbi:MAG TPA: TRAP transporter small permease subunit [Tepidisphaeraceae bacterium]|nr:TRAP transporter small permease subunit [Tepidisphaeraceae bacterium]